MVRHDGRVTVCCNEEIINGHGPDFLSNRLPGKTVSEKLKELRSNSIVKGLANVGPTKLYSDQLMKPPPDSDSICDQCWSLFND